MNQRLRIPCELLVPSDLVRELAEQHDVVGVLLGGSLSRGQAITGSDIDLFVFRQGGLHQANMSQSFDFMDGWMLDIRHIDIDTVQCMAEQLRNGKVDQAADRLLPQHFLDQIMESVILSWRGTQYQLQDLRALIEARDQKPLANAMIRSAARRALAIATVAERAWQGHDTSDALVLRRHAYQQLLIGWQMLVCGRCVASKRCPELIASACGADGREMLTKLLGECGLEQVNVHEAHEIAQRRLSFRREYVEVCNALASQIKTNEMQIHCDMTVRRESRAFDYYSPTIAAGHHLGAVNHLRSISGLWMIPNRLLAAMGQASCTPVSHFMAAEELPLGFRQEWWSLMGLSCDLLDEGPFCAHVRKLSFWLNAVASESNPKSESEWKGSISVC